MPLKIMLETVFFLFSTGSVIEPERSVSPTRYQPLRFLFQSFLLSDAFYRLFKLIIRCDDRTTICRLA